MGQLSIDEVYFLVRVGNWDQARLAEYVNVHVQEALDDALAEKNQDTDSAFHDGEHVGYQQGVADGRVEGYDEGYEAGRDAGYDEGVREGERNAGPW